MLYWLISSAYLSFGRSLWMVGSGWFCSALGRGSSSGLGLKGPSMTCDTDGSSSLTAVHLGGEAVLHKGHGVSNESGPRILMAVVCASPAQGSGRRLLGATRSGRQKSCKRRTDDTMRRERKAKTRENVEEEQELQEQETTRTITTRTRARRRRRGGGARGWAVDVPSSFSIRGQS